MQLAIHCDYFGDYFGRRKMRLDDPGAFRLTGIMGKSISRKRSFAVNIAGGDAESARGRLLSAATRLFCGDPRIPLW
jgi:hypothetical protein